MRSFFISGTDTGVGKTIFSSILMAHAATRFKSVHYHKAINTGIEEDNDVKTVISLLKNRFDNQSACLGLGLRRPLSPHLSAHYQNTLIDFSALLKRAKDACTSDLNIIEGAGGLMVPINNRHKIIDLIKALELPVILIARSTLGTINHSLLSLEALRLRGIKVAAIAMVGQKNSYNERSVAYYGDIKNIIHIPFLPHINANNIELIAKEKALELDKILSN